MVALLANTPIACFANTLTVGEMDSRLDGKLQSTRAYIAQASGELAEMARDIGDRRLGHLLDLAATFAEMRPEIVRTDEGPRPSR